MKMTSLSKKLSFIVCIVLIAAMALVTTGCNDNKNNTEETPSVTSTTLSENNVIGKGETSFSLTVSDGIGNQAEYTVYTDKKTVGEALVELDFISGDEGPYGLYIKTVNGITVDYDKDGKYWAFYVNGEYAMAGVDTTEIYKNAKYELKVE